MKAAELESNLSETKKAIDLSCKLVAKDPSTIRLIGVTKTQSADTIRQAYNAGITDIGENYLQEALTKMDALRDLDIGWHFIGSIQSNKTRLIAENFEWVHSVDSLKLATRLSDQCPKGKTLNLLIQLNVDKDPNKRGIDVTEIEELVSKATDLPNIKIRGLMIILAEQTDPVVGYKTASKIFEKLKTLKSNQENIYWDTLSMGMSKDFEQAIQSGSNTIRLGTNLFGPRGN